jgi:hypothetical protein
MPESNSTTSELLDQLQKEALELKDVALDPLQKAQIYVLIKLVDSTRRLLGLPELSEHANSSINFIQKNLADLKTTATQPLLGKMPPSIGANDK